MDVEMVYSGKCFLGKTIETEPYNHTFFDWEIQTESDLFKELRRLNGIRPFCLRDSSERELLEIRSFFQNHARTFRFVRRAERLAGSILFRENFIQSLCVAREFQRQGLGSDLTRYAVNTMLKEGYKEVRLCVLAGNQPALRLYEKLGFVRHERKNTN